MESYILKAEDLTQVSQHLIPPLLEAVLVDYSKNVEQARDAEVLSVMATIITRLGVSIFISNTFFGLMTTRISNLLNFCYIV